MPFDSVMCTLINGLYSSVEVPSSVPLFRERRVIVVCGRLSLVHVIHPSYCFDTPARRTVESTCSSFAYDMCSE
jgi:hypothetical protein